MVAEGAGDRAGDGRAALDRWLHVFMAGEFLLAAAVGFGPSSVGVLAGVLPNPPLIVHVHAALMAAWLGLHLVQTLLAAAGRADLHKVLGLTSLALAPAIVATTVVAVLWRYDLRIERGQGLRLPPEVASEFGVNLLMVQVRSIVFFIAFVAWGLLVRDRDAETHKRTMLLATLSLLAAAVDRMIWLPGAMPTYVDASNVYLLVLLAPALVYDIARRGRPHTVYVVGAAALALTSIAMHFLWGSPLWLEAAPRLMEAVAP